MVQVHAVIHDGWMQQEYHTGCGEVPVKRLSWTAFFAFNDCVQQIWLSCIIMAIIDTIQQITYAAA